MTIYERIKKCRQEQKISQDELAKLLGYTSRSSISKIESGENDIPQSKVEAFATALKTTPAYLMGWEEQKSSTPNIIKESISFYGQSEIQLVELYRKLSPEGKEKIIEYATDLVSSGRYKKDK